MISITTLFKKSFHAELLFTDTDSLTYEIKLKDVYQKVFAHKDLFDFNNFLKDSKFYDNQNEIVVGKMKAVNKEIPIKKFVGLKSEMNAMLPHDGEESNTAKGAHIATEFIEFRDTLFNKKVVRHKMKRIQ